MKLKLNNIEVENDKVVNKDSIDLLEISTKVGEEEDNKLFQWVRPLHLDDDDANFDLGIVAHAREFGVNVDQGLFEEVHSERFNKDNENSFEVALNSQPSINCTSIGQSSRHRVTSTSASSYDGSRDKTINGGDNAGNDGRDVEQQQQSQYPMSALTCEDDFMHYT